MSAVRSFVRRVWGGAHTRSISWGFIDQTFSSATNFGLTLLAGRMLGPSGLGTVFLGFSVFLIATGLQRRLVTEPLLAASSAVGPDERRLTGDYGVTLAVGTAVAMSAGTAAFGLVVPGFAGRGVLLVSPWIGFAMVQDMWRSLLFRDGRGSSAAANDGVWALVMAVSVPIAIAIGSDWAVIGCWGLGALAGAAVGFRQTGLRPRSPRAAWSWWRLEAWPFGRWNAGAAIATNVGGSASAFVLSGILGAGALGGMRAVQSVFAPLTLITPAVTLPGLPALARAHARDPDEARKLAFTLSGVAVAAAGSYALALALGAWRLLPFLFGHEFVKYRELLWPTSVGQLATASALGFLLWIKARRRGRLLMLTRAIGTIVALGLVAVLAVRYGLLGAAWGGAIGAFVSAAILAYGALRPDPPSAEPPVVRERVTAP